jgi:hypothetical protein
MKEIRVWGIGGLLGNGNAEVLEKKNTPCSATLSSTNPPRTHQRLPSDSMYHNLQLQNTVTLVDQTVVCLTNEMSGWKIKKKLCFKSQNGRDFSVHCHFQEGSGVQLASHPTGGGAFPKSKVAAD